MKTDLSQSCGHCWVFQICWLLSAALSQYHLLGFEIPQLLRWWNSINTLALFIVMLPKAHLSSHSSMSGSRWVIIPSWLSGSWRSFLYSSSVYSCHLLLISSASARSVPFLSFIELICAWNVPLVSQIFLKRSLVFPILPVWVPNPKFSNCSFAFDLSAFSVFHQLFSTHFSFLDSLGWDF